MLLFEDDVQNSFRDHVDEDIMYTLPHTVAVHETDSGTPDFFLLRYAGDFATERGGILRGTLKLLYPQTEPEDTLTEVEGSDSGMRSRPVSFMAGYSRLCLRPFGGSDVQTGQWHKIDALEQSDVTMLAYLDSSEAQILRSLTSDGNAVVSMELHLVYRGLVAGIPWLVRADTRRLNTHLQAHLGDEAATIDHIMAAFLSLPDGELDFRYIGNDDEEIAPSISTLRTEAALHALDHLFEPVERPDFMSPPRFRYLSRDSEIASNINYTLFRYRLEERAYSIDWSISRLLDELNTEEREALFPTVTQVGPFARVRIHVVNSLAFDSAYLTDLTVDVKNVGPRGTFENRSFRFTAESKQVESFSTFQPVLTSALDLQYRITAVLAPPSPHEWPVVIQRDFCPGEGVVVDINRETAGIDFVHCSADAGVFARAGAVGLTLALPDGQEPLAKTRLTADRPSVRIALPDIAPDTILKVICRAYASDESDAASITLRDDILIGREVVVPAHQLEVLDADEIAVALDPRASESYPFVAFEIAPDPDADEGKLHTLDPGRTHTWRVLRENVFSRLQYRFRLHVVAKHDEEGTLPLVRTRWFHAIAHDHLVTADFIAEHMNPA